MKAGKLLGVDDNGDSSTRLTHNIMGEIKPNPKSVFAEMSVDERTEVAMNEMKNKIDREDAAIKKFHSSLQLEVKNVIVNQETETVSVVQEVIANVDVVPTGIIEAHANESAPAADVSIEASSANESAPAADVQLEAATDSA